MSGGFFWGSLPLDVAFLTAKDRRILAKFKTHPAVAPCDLDSIA